MAKESYQKIIKAHTRSRKLHDEELVKGGAVIHNRVLRPTEEQILAMRVQVPSDTSQETTSREKYEDGRLDGAKAQWLVDYRRIATHPAVYSLTDIDLEDGGAFGQTNLYAQQFVISRMFVQGIMGNQDNLSSRKIMDTEANNSVLSLQLRGINQFHASFLSYAQAQEPGQHAEQIIAGDIAGNVTAMVQDIMQLYDQGLVSNTGESSNLQVVGQILRYLNVNLLFSDQLRQPDMVNVFYDKLYEKVVGEPTNSYLNQAARNYAQQYEKPVTCGSNIQKLRKQAGSNIDDVTNRAAFALMIGNAKGTLMAAQQNPDSRDKYATALRTIGRANDLKLLNSDIASLIRRLEDGTLEEANAQGVQELKEDVAQITQLNWEILPPGELEAKARNIVETQRQDGKEVTIDLERLNILDNIRKEWGVEASYYVYGALGKRRVIKKDGREEPDQYLLLILQDVDRGGNVRQEHAIAESPIAGTNALYVFRQDVSENLDWKEVMALPKNYARAFNARAVKHTVPRQAPEGYLVAAMTEKVRTLMTCQPEEFLTIEFDGERGFRIPKFIVHQTDEQQ